MSEIINLVLQIALFVLVLLLVPCMYRAFVGPSPADRLQAVDTVTTLLIGIFLLLALVERSSLLIDVSLVLAAFGFIATLALSRYLSEGRVF